MLRPGIRAAVLPALRPEFKGMLPLCHAPRALEEGVKPTPRFQLDPAEQEQNNHYD
jgi:hypothetical protein